MVSNLILTATFVDVQKPVDTVQNLAGAGVSRSVFTVSGAASDNGKVVGVWYQLNNGVWTSANTTNNWTNWSADLSLQPGGNTLRNYAVDGGAHDYVYVADSQNDVIEKSCRMGW